MSPRTQDALSRKPGGKGRFDPSEPLHMTTRHAAARNGRPRGSSSINGSVDDDESRRGSLDDIQSTTAHSLSPPKGRRISGEPEQSATYSNLHLGSMATGNKMSKTASGLLTSPTRRIDQQVAQSPSRKRKRTYSHSLGTQPIDTNANASIFLHTTNEDINALEEVIVVLPEDHSFDRVSAGSSSGQDAERYMAATQSTEVTPAATPMASEPVSPVSDETNPTPRYSGKHVDIVMADLDVPGDDEELDDIDEDDVPAVVEDMDDGADLEDDEDQAASGPPKRVTGRRRADHHETKIEATMRRQLQLKSAYRNIARALKPLLAEVATKTVEELESNPTKHQQVPEYEGEGGIQQLLDAALANRKRQLELQVKHNKKQLRDRWLGERAARIDLCQNNVDSSRDTTVDQVLHDTLKIAREIRYEEALEEDKLQYATEDEDGDVLHRPKHTNYGFTRGAPLDARYDSRSRKALEIERAINDLERRFMILPAKIEAAKQRENGNSEHCESFTVLDTTTREAGETQRESIRNVSILNDAATEVEQRASLIVPNEKAFGLQMLADLASRPSLNLTGPPPPISNRLGNPFSPEQSQMRPPTSQRAQSGFEIHHRPAIQMSPGTEKFVNGPWNSTPSPQQHSRHGSQSERFPGEHRPGLSPLTSKRGTTLVDHPGIMDLLGIPIPNAPYRIQPPPRQSDVQVPHDVFQGHRPTSRGTPRRHGAMSHSQRDIHAGHRGAEASSPGAQSGHNPGRDTSGRPSTSHSRSLSGLIDHRGVYSPSRDSQLRSDRSTPQGVENSSQPGEHQTRSDLLAGRTTLSHPGHESHAKPQAQAESSEAREADEPRPPSILAVQTALQAASLEQPSSEGATDLQVTGGEDVPVGPTRETREKTREEPREEPQTHRPGSRASSRDPSATTDISGSQDEDRGRLGRSKDGKHSLKPNKAQRGGQSRKQAKEAREANKRTSQKRPSHGMPPGAEGGGQMSRWRLANTSETTKPSTFTSRVPTGVPQSAHHGPDLPYPALPSYSQQPPRPFSQSYGSHAPNFPHATPRHPHRNSLPGAGDHHPWPPASFTSGYGHPHGPASMGPPPETWREGPPGAAPSHISGPPPGLSRTSSSNSHYGGPAIAPARPDQRYPYGSGPPGGNHPPAFAQQQRHSEGSGGRRRTHSDAPRNTKWQHYNPSGRK